MDSQNPNAESLRLQDTRARIRTEMEYELLDTGVFDGDRCFDVFVEYAKAAPEDVLVRITSQAQPGSGKPAAGTSAT